MPDSMLSYPVRCEPMKLGVCAEATGKSSGIEPASRAFDMNAFKSSPMTSDMQEVHIAIIFGLYMAYEFFNPSIMLARPPNTAASSVIESETAGNGSRKCLARLFLKYAAQPCEPCSYGSVPSNPHAAKNAPSGWHAFVGFITRAFLAKFSSLYSTVLIHSAVFIHTPKVPLSFGKKKAAKENHRLKSPLFFATFFSRE